MKEFVKECFDEMYLDLFYKPKRLAVQEKTVPFNTMKTMAIILVCLSAMTFSAFAYFSNSITSGFNQIKTASFATNVVVQRADATEGEDTECSMMEDAGTRYAMLDAGRLYTATVEMAASSTARTGYVVIYADGCPDAYHTQQIGVDALSDDGTRYQLSFDMMATVDTLVFFEDYWGTSVYYGEDDSELYISDGENILLIVNGVTEPPVLEEELVEEEIPEEAIPEGELSASETPSEPASAPPASAERGSEQPSASETPSESTDNPPASAESGSQQPSASETPSESASTPPASAESSGGQPSASAAPSESASTPPASAESSGGQPSASAAPSESASTPPASAESGSEQPSASETPSESASSSPASAESSSGQPSVSSAPSESAGASSADSGTASTESA